MHILTRKSSFESTSHALAWQTTSRSAGFVKSDLSQNVFGSGANPSDVKKFSPYFTIPRGSVFSCTQLAREAFTPRSNCFCSASSINFCASAAVAEDSLPASFAACGICAPALPAKIKLAHTQTKTSQRFIRFPLMPLPVAFCPQLLSTLQSPAQSPPGPHHNVSPRAPNAAPYPAPRRHADATHRTVPRRSFRFSNSRKSQCSSAPSSDRFSVPRFLRCLPPAASHFHDRRAIAPATSPTRSVPPLQSLLPASSLRRTSCDRCAPSR